MTEKPKAETATTANEANVAAQKEYEQLVAAAEQTAAAVVDKLHRG